MQPFADGIEHLYAELARLDLLLERQIARLRAADLLVESELRGLFVSDSHVDAVLAAPVPPPNGGLDASIRQVEEALHERIAASLKASVALPLVWLAQVYGMGRAELDALILAAAPAVALRYETLYGYVQNDVTKKRPTVELALALGPDDPAARLAAQEIFAPHGPLLQHRLVRMVAPLDDPAPPRLAHFLAVDDYVIDFLRGARTLDARLSAFAAFNTGAPDLFRLPLPESLRRELALAAQYYRSRPVIFMLHGASDVCEDAASALAAEMNRPLLVAQAHGALAANGPWAETLALLRRSAEFSQTGLCLAGADALLDCCPTPNLTLDALVLGLADFDGPLFLCSAQPRLPAAIWPPGTSVLTFDLPLPDFTSGLELWQSALDNAAGPLAPDVDPVALANQFTLTRAQIARAVQHAAARTSLRPPDEPALTQADLFAGARAQAQHDLGRLAHKVVPIYAWDDIVLPPRQMQQLREVYAAVRYRHVVYSEWGFGRKLASQGLNALFYGASGTGKTMAAEVLAHALEQDLYKIDLSGIVSKYIGETEKNLDRVFHEAETSNAVLFFDEADALFGKRSEVRDAHDRYANIEVAYLLQKMEAYGGISILATNLRGNIDDAFARRLHHTIEFPFPSADYRERIWRSVFPPGAPLDADLDIPFLARQFEFSGGNIRNVALGAAFMAAAEGASIAMRHAILACARELQKMGKLPAHADFRDYYDLIRERS